RRTISCVEMLFLAIERQLHRRFRGLREARTQDPFGADLRLAAEAAAHVLRDDTYVGLWNLETVGELLRRAVHGLRRDPGRQLVAFPFAHHRVAFHAHVRDDVRRICCFDGLSSFREARGEVAGFLRLTLPYVPALEDLAGVGIHGLFDAGDVGQYLILNFD